MANEKSNNVLILQSTKKTQVSPLLSAVIGFFSGIALCAITGLIYFNLQNQPTSIHTVNLEQENPVQSAELKPQQTDQHLPLEAASTLNSDINDTSAMHILNDEMKDGRFEADIVNAFKHPQSVKQTPSSAVQEDHPSPFAVTEIHQVQKKIIKPDVQHAVAAHLSSNARSASKSPIPSAIKTNNSVKINIPESGPPHGSVQITATKSAASVQDEPKDPPAES